MCRRPPRHRPATGPDEAGLIDPVSLAAQLDPAIWPAYASSALRIIRRRLTGPRRVSGDAGSICRAIVDACWTGAYFAASAGHFR